MLRILVKFYLGFSKQLYYFTSSQPWSEIAYCIILLPTWDILLKMNSWIIYTFKSLFAIAMLWLGGINHFHTRTPPPTKTHTYAFSLYWAELTNSWTRPLSTELHLGLGMGATWWLWEGALAPDKASQGRQSSGEQATLSQKRPVLFSWTRIQLPRPTSAQRPKPVLSHAPSPAPACPLSPSQSSRVSLVPRRVPPRTLVLHTFFLFLDLSPHNPQSLTRLCRRTFTH